MGPGPSIAPLPYHVHRTASQLLPIYHLAKRGGNLRQTRIRKIQGDINVLKDELRIALGLEQERFFINKINGHIIIKVCTSQDHHITWSDSSPVLRG